MQPYSLADDLEDSPLRDELYGPRPAAPIVATAPPAYLYRMAFTGTGGEYFRIWIVNLLLTLLTVCIYSAFAKVRETRYYWQNTRLAGFAFESVLQNVRILLFFRGENMQRAMHP